MEINQTVFEDWKRKHRGFYHKFNQQVIKWHLNKIFDYDYLIETAKNFDSFTDFYYFHTQNKNELIETHCEQMYSEALRKNLGPKKEWAFECLVVRLGNAYNGKYIENKIIETLKLLSPYIFCNETDRDIDMNYKVDAIVELSGIDKLAIQIKPFSYTTYDDGSELQFHNRFTLEFGCEVYYLLYRNRNEIIFNNIEMKLSDKNKIIKQIEQILVYK